MDLNDPRAAAVLAGAQAIGGILAPAAGPYGALAAAALQIGVTYWGTFAKKAADGTLTTEELKEASAMTGGKLDALEAEVKRREAAGI